MPIRFNEGFSIKAPFPIDDRLIVDRVSGTTASLEALTPQYNYRNMIVWVREEKAFYYLIDNPDSPNNPGITFSDWVLFSGGGGATLSCTKSGLVSGMNFTTNGLVATASVTFQVPYLYASYSVAVTGLTNYDTLGNYDDYVYSVFNRTTTGFDIQVNAGTIPLGATAMWISSCFEGSNDIAQVLVGGGGSSSAIDLEQIAYGTGTGITSSNTFTFDQSNTNLILGNGKFSVGNPSYYSAHFGGYNNTITSAKSSVILGSTGSGIVSSSKSTFANSTTIIGSYNVCSRGSNYSSLINNFNTEICGSTASVIIGSKNALLKDSLYSSILNTYNSTICTSKYSTVITGTGSKICESCFSNIVGSDDSCILRTYESTIISSRKSCLIGGTASSIEVLFGALGPAIRSQILSGSLNKIWGSEDSLVIGSRGSTICRCELAFLIGDFNSCMHNSTGISLRSSSLFATGSNNIANIVSSGSKFCSTTCNAIIIGGTDNCIYSSRSSVIIGSDDSVINNSKYSTIQSGCFNYVAGSTFSMIFGGCKNTITQSHYGQILSGRDNLLFKNLHSAIISGASNSITTTFQCTRHSVIIGGCKNDILGGSLGSSDFSNIVGGQFNLVEESASSMVHSSCKSCIVGQGNFSSVTSNCSSYISNSKVSSIIAGRFNCITGVSGQSLVIFGESNQIIQSFGGSIFSKSSAILGGCQNIMTASSNSLILGGCDLQMDRVDNIVYVPSIRGFGSVQFDLATTSTDYTLTQDNFTLLAYPTTAGLTVSLPLATQSVHRLYVIKKDGSSTQSVVYINPNTSAGNTIEGYSGSIELINPWDYNILQSDGVNLWIKLGGAVGLNL